MVAAVAALVGLGAIYVAASAFSAPAPTAPGSTLAGQASGTPSAASPAASPGQTGAPPTATTSGATLLTWGPAGQAPGHLHPGQFEFGSFRPALSFELDGTK